MSDYTIPSSLVKIYKRCPIIPEKRFVVEDIESFLVTLTKQEISNFQYIKHALFLEIKVNWSQVYQEYDDSDYNYLSIKNSDSNKIVYYFIKKRVVRANSTILFELEMDVLNTFEWNKDYAVSQRTSVLREHKDRYLPTYVEGVKYYYPVIDFFSEGIQCPLYKADDKDLKDNNNKDNWYLIYKNQSTPTEANPVVIDCYLAPKESGIQVKVNEDEVFNANNYPDTYGYSTYVSLSCVFNGGVGFSITMSNNITSSLITQTPTDYESFLVSKVGNQLFIRKVHYSYVGGVWQNTTLEAWRVDSFTCSLGDSVSVNIASSWPSSLDPSDINGTWESGDNIYTLNAFETLDRTDVLLNKIIAIPYFPSTHTTENGVIVLDEKWTYDSTSGFLKLVSLSTKFENNIEAQALNPLSSVFSLKPTSYFVDGLRNDGDETKIYHSDFYQYKFVYDSFAYMIPLETIKTSYILNPSARVKFTFVMTNTMNSRFLFKFDIARFNLQEDYANILCVSRNNEVVIYNSPYLNYLRTSYNYDVKAKERAVFTSRLSAGLGVAGQVLGAGLSLASGNPAVAIQGVLSAGTSIVTTLTNSIMNVAQAEENFARKLDEMKVQGVSVSGSDDLDLLEYYSKNLLKYCVYQVSTRVEDLLCDLFYYTGYKTNEFKIPDTKTRRQFNFLQCELKIDEHKTIGGVSKGGKYIPDDCLAEIINQFAIGVTFIHHYDSKWDFKQETSNFERSIL